MDQPPGTIYLLHFNRPYQHARHYLGWAKDLDARLADHQAGRGARLLQVARAAGITWLLARTWPGGRARERQLKNQGGASRRCPLCGVTPRKEAGQMRNSDHAHAARDGTRAATPAITQQAVAATAPGAVQPDAHDSTAMLPDGGATRAGQAHTAAYSRAAAGLAAELPDPGRRAPEPGTPHPDPWLAARGWHVHWTGVYVRDPDREAGQ